MQSRNKPAQTAMEREHADYVAQCACVICDAPPPSQVHEPEQGLWLCSIALCPPCHGGPGYPDGWHGTRDRWTLRKMTELKAIAETIRRVMVLRSMDVSELVQVTGKSQEPRTRLSKPSKIVPRPIHPAHKG